MIMLVNYLTDSLEGKFFTSVNEGEIIIVIFSRGVQGGKSAREVNNIAAPQVMNSFVGDELILG